VDSDRTGDDYIRLGLIHAWIVKRREKNSVPCAPPVRLMAEKRTLSPVRLTNMISKGRSRNALQVNQESQSQSAKITSRLTIHVRAVAGWLFGCLAKASFSSLPLP